MRQATLLLLLGFAGAFAAESPTFEVATVKPATNGPRNGFRFMQGGPGTADPGRMTYTNMPLKSLIEIAYDIKDFQLECPGWLDSTRFDIQAKVPEGATKEQARAMLENLLIERFHLTVHHESKEMKLDEMVVGKGGPKLKASTEDPNVGGPPAGPPHGPPKMDARGFPQLDRPGFMVFVRMVNGSPVAHLTARAQPVKKIADMLSFEMKQPVIDKTGLAGNYDFNLEYTPQGMGMMGPPPGANSSKPVEASDPGTPIAAALEQQLGLKLESKKAPADIVVVDSVDKTPTDN